MHYMPFHLDGVEGFLFATQISSHAHRVYRVESRTLSNLVWDKSIKMKVIFSSHYVIETEEAKLLRRFKGTAVQTCSD